MDKAIWLLMSPILAIMVLGILMMVMGTYWMIFEEVKAGVQPFMCGMVAFAMTGTAFGFVYYSETK